MRTVNVMMSQSFCYVLSCATKCVIFFTFFPFIYQLRVTTGSVLKEEEKNQQNSPLIFFINCISAQVIHYSLQPCLCNLTYEMLAIKACTCNNEKKKHFILLLNKNVHEPRRFLVKSPVCDSTYLILGSGFFMRGANLFITWFVFYLSQSKSSLTCPKDCLGCLLS